MVSEDFQEEIFLHYSYIQMDGYKTLDTGQAVLFEATQTPTGIHAKAVEPVTKEGLLDIDHEIAAWDQEPDQSKVNFTESLVENIRV